MLKRYGSMGASAGTIARQLRTLGAAVHFDPDWGASDNGTTSSWTDPISGTVCVSSSAATRLIYSSSQAGLNNRPGWSGTVAASTRLISTTGTIAALFDGLAPYSLYCVRKSTNLAAINVACCFGSTTLTQYQYHGAVLTTGGQFATRRDGVGQTQNASIVLSGTDASIDSYVFDGSVVSEWSNGSPGLTAQANTRSPTCDRFAIGCLLSANVPSSFFEGAIGDIVIFAGAHTNAQRRQIEQLLAIKYGWTVLQGVSGFTAANFYATANGAGVRGATGVGFWLDALIRPNAVPVAQEYIATTYASPNGLGLYSSAASAAAFKFVGGVVGLSPTKTIAASDVGKLALFGGGDNAATIRGFWNGAETGAGTASAGFNEAAASVPMNIGRRIATDPASTFTLFGVAGGNVPQTAANQAARAAAIKAAGRFVATGGATPTHGWAIDSNAATIADLVGSDTLTRNGTLSAAQIIMTAWPW